MNLNLPKATAIDIAEQIAASPATVWHCLNDPACVRAWFGAHMTLDAVPGGGFREVWRDGERTVVTSGKVLGIEPSVSLILFWRDEDWPADTTVTITLEPRGRHTLLRLAHGGWDALGSESATLAEAHRRGWAAHLRALRRFAEAAERDGTGIADPAPKRG
jgi:uncharacterized protein YndB with AHSA1/START domain